MRFIGGGSWTRGQRTRFQVGLLIRLARWWQELSWGRGPGASPRGPPLRLLGLPSSMAGGPQECRRHILQILASGVPQHHSCQALGGGSRKGLLGAKERGQTYPLKGRASGPETRKRDCRMRDVMPIRGATITTETICSTPLYNILF